VHGVGKDTFHCFEGGDLCPYTGEMLGGEATDLDARLTPALGGKCQQRADFIEGKSEFPCPPNEASVRLSA